MQLACAAVIGILAGCVLRGTSSFIFVTLGIDASQKQNLDHQSHQQIFDEEEDFGVTESGTRSESSGRLSSRRTKSKQEPRDDAYDMFERQWKLQRSSEKPKRRRRGLLSQTIHEESSSDFS
ncbi:hypothetical protein F4804DRAFT_330648 [Jackrogersella minutella]|nr:hypothetical protein F4804DRAFT_330648 [Jackrogersella minutella]